MMSIDPATLLSHIQSFIDTDSATLPPALRRSLQLAASRLAHNLQDPATAIQRLTLGQAAESAALKLALDINLFPTFLRADTFTSRTLSELSTATSTDYVLLNRLLRFLAAFHVIIEHPGGTFSLSPRCSTLSDERFSTATNTILPLIRAMMDAFPLLIQENGRNNPTDRLNGAAQRAWDKPGQELFEVIGEMGPSIGQAFSVFLSLGSQDAGRIWEVYDVKGRLIEEFESEKSGGNLDRGESQGKEENEKVFWVDVGGGFGQSTVDLIREFTNVPSIGRCIVQDLSPVIDLVKINGLDRTPDIEYMAHIFFDKQPIEGARTYYLRQVFHNWQDGNCFTILRRLSAAMTSGYSRLLIHDIVMPEQGASQWEVMMDWLMMSGYSTMERTRSQWEELVGQVEGLRIVGIHMPGGGGEGLIEIVKD